MRVLIKYFFGFITFLYLAIIQTMCVSYGNISNSLATLDNAIIEISEELKTSLKQSTEIAIVEMESPLKELSSYLKNELNEKLIKLNYFVVLARNEDLDLIFEEQIFNLSGFVSDESSVSIGKMLGAKSIICGTFDDFGYFYQLRVRALNVTSGQIEFSRSVRIRNERSVTNMLLAVGRKQKNNIKEDAVVYYNYGREYLASGNYDNAIRYFSMSINVSTNFAEAYRGRGLACAFNGNYLDGINDISFAIQYNKNQIPELYATRGMMYLLLGDRNKAILDYTKAIEINKNESSCFYWRGLCYFDIKEYFKALSDFTKSIELNSNNINAFKNRAATYYELKNYTRAIEDYNIIIENEPLDYNMIFSRGLSYFRADDYLNAITDFSNGINLNGNDYKAYLYRANSYYLTRQYELAIQDANKSLSLNDKNINVLFIRSSSYYGLKQYNKAKDDIIEILKLDPNNKDANELLNILLNEGY